nr:c-type cytochrome [Chthoniobacterales bacterium]
EVTDAGGWKLNSGSVFSSGKIPNTGNRKSDDGRTWVGGLAMRIDADGKHLTPLAHNFRNSYEVAIDSFGDLWQTDNDDDGNQSCRMSWLMEGGNHGFFSADGTRAWVSDRRPGQSIQTAHWHQEDPGVLPPGEMTGAGGPTGIVVYEGGLLPKEWIGSVFACDAGRNRVSIHKPIESGAGFRFERSDLIVAKPQAAGAAEDESRWFRPSDVAIGTDGAVYVADWFDPIVGGHDMRDKKGGGRILRIAPKGDRTKPPKIDLTSLDGQIEALNSPAVNIRHVAASKLVARATKPSPEILETLKRLSVELNWLNVGVYRSARAMWVMARSGAGLQSLEHILEEGDSKTRLMAFRALRSVDPNVLEHAARRVYDTNAAVRREIAIALRDVPFEECDALLLKLAEQYDGQDRFYLEAFGIACEKKESKIYPVLLEKLGGEDPLKWSDTMVGLAWRLHPVESLEAFAKRAASASLSPEARVQAVTAIAFMNDEKAAEVMAELAASEDSVVREQASWWMNHRATNDWKEFAAAKAFVIGPASQPQARFSQDRMVMLDESAPKRKRESAARRIAQDPEGAKILIALAGENAFPKVLVESVIDPLYRNPDLGIRALASQYFPRKTASGEALPPVAELAKIPGDATRGKEIFASNTAACIQCHTFDGQGKDVGPDLTAIKTKFRRPELLDSILNPSAAIAFGFEAWVIKTRDNQVYAGFIIADGETVTVKESSGEQRSIPAGDIVLRKKQTISVMPDNVGLGLTSQQLADLAEYLLTTEPKRAN